MVTYFQIPTNISIWIFRDGFGNQSVWFMEILWFSYDNFEVVDFKLSRVSRKVTLSMLAAVNLIEDLVVCRWWSWVWQWSEVDFEVGSTWTIIMDVATATAMHLHPLTLPTPPSSPSSASQSSDAAVRIGCIRSCSIHPASWITDPVDEIQEIVVLPSPREHHLRLYVNLKIAGISEVQTINLCVFYR